MDNSEPQQQQIAIIRSTEAIIPIFNIYLPTCFFNLENELTCAEGNEVLAEVTELGTSLVRVSDILQC